MWCQPIPSALWSGVVGGDWGTPLRHGARSSSRSDGPPHHGEVPMSILRKITNILVYGRWIDCQHQWGYTRSVMVASLLVGSVEHAGQYGMKASPQPPHTAPAPPKRLTPSDTQPDGWRQQCAPPVAKGCSSGGQAT